VAIDTPGGNLSLKIKSRAQQITWCQILATMTDKHMTKTANKSIQIIKLLHFSQLIRTLNLFARRLHPPLPFLSPPLELELELDRELLDE
jgi:hypothetical protein